MSCIHGYDNGDYCRECCAVSDAKRLGEELEDAKALLTRCRKLLEELEWTVTLHDGPGCHTTGCPDCGETKYHKDDCELAALLREIRK